MDRQIVYTGALPQDTDILKSQRNAMLGIAFIAQAVFGTSQVADGLACTPTTPNSLAVNIGSGSVYALENLDDTAYGSLAADTADQIVKQGLNLAPATPFNTPAPTTPGQSTNFLIQAKFQESDTDSTVLAYYNASNPASPYSGPGNNSAAQNTRRQGGVSLQLKIGASAATGTQVTPAPDSGYLGLWVITVAYGQTTVTANNIALYPNAALIPSSVKLPQLLATIQQRTGNYASDTGSANHYVVTLSPAPQALTNGLVVRFKATNPNTAAADINVNGLGVRSLVKYGAAPLLGGEITAGACVTAVYDGTNFQITGIVPHGGDIYAVDSGTANSLVVNPTPAVPAYVAGLTLRVKVANTSGGGQVLVNVSGLGTKQIRMPDGNYPITGFLPAGAVVEIVYDGTLFQIISTTIARPGLPTQVIFTGSGTWTCPFGVTKARVRATGGGGGGGGATGTQNGGGGGAGGTGEGIVAVTPGAGYPVGIGGGGAGGVGDGGDGAASNFNGVVTGSGGQHGSSAAGNTAGGGPGVGSGGTLNLYGGHGSDGGFVTNAPGGMGGASYYGGGGRSGSGAGISGQAPGSGGGGAWNGSGSGGNGAAGIVVIEY